MSIAPRILLLLAVSTWGSAVVFSMPDATSARPQAPATEAHANAPLDLSLFEHSDNCVACHNNLSTKTGEDVSIGVSWRGSIMGNSARDPYFHASVRREIMEHPSRAGDIQDECASCHMPTAHRVANAAGRQTDIFAHLAPGEASELDSLALDGVTCTVCHQITSERLGTPESFNANFVLAAPLADGSRRAFGPFAPDAGRSRIMHSVTRFQQTEGLHIRESELCATCHTLITEALGPDGRVIGSLPEQMNYQEWRHSAFVDEGRGCQSCHMPRAEGPVRVSSVLGEERDGLSRHTFLGGNAFMLRMMSRYRADLGIEASSAELNATANATARQMEHDTATVDITRAERRGNTVEIDVEVTNLTGHKFPTGYPSRRAWLHLTLRDVTGGVVFESGGLAGSGEIAGNDADAGPAAFEPHYGDITAADQVQVYESIMGTPAGLPTTGLLQATQYLKDNRLLPRGFDKATAAINIAVFGQAATDTDFRGGGDRVRYRVPVQGAGALSAEVELRYQSIGFRWAQNLSGLDAPEPRRFVGYFNTLAPISSLLVDRASRPVLP